jgi:hypothetical protein
LIRAALVAVALGLAAVAAGCASADTVKAARGEGLKRTYRFGYDAVYDAALAAVQGRRLAVSAASRETGEIVAASNAAFGTLGEHVAVFVSRQGAQVTLVEVVSKPVMRGTFPPDWQYLLQSDIEAALGPRPVR